jgi:hypothetical protein
MDMFNRFSVFERSGKQVFAGDPLQIVNPPKQTKELGVPWLPPGGVTPPEPEK